MSPIVSKTIKWLWIVFLGGLGFLFLLITLINLGVFGALPTFKDLENPKSNLATEIISADGVVMGTYYYENRSNASYNEFPAHLIDALIATEDIRYYEHSGIDFKRTFTIVFYNLIGKTQGASTISQQLAKNLFPRKNFDTIFEKIFTKLKEWITAVKIERNYTKDEIIRMYLNTVDFGANAYGIKSAALTYFNKKPQQLDLAECALLVGMLKGTTLYSPLKNYERALARRNTVLSQMNKYGYLTNENFEKVSKLPIELSFRAATHNQGLATYFREYLRLEVQQWCNQPENYKANGEPYDIYRDGLKIYTTINSTMQQYAEEALSAHLAELQVQFNNHWKGKGEPWAEFPDIMESAIKRSERYKNLRDEGYSDADIRKNFDQPTQMKIFTWTGSRDTLMSPIDSIKYYKMYLQSGFMSMDPHTGHIKAWVGGPNYEYFKYDHVKSGKRQVGSTFKPFVYTVAIDNGLSPCFEVPNEPIVFEDFDNWSPKNADGQVGGYYSLRQGLAESKNLVTAYVMKQFGPQAVVNYAKKMGISSDVPPYPSICLGTADISLYEMVGAFSTFANRGVWTEPTYLLRIEDKNGNVILNKYPKKVDALSEQTAYVMLYMLKGTTTLKGGTGLRIRGRKYNIPYPVAAKTGTTQNHSDGWFIGATPDLVSGAWTGCEDRVVHFRSLNLGEGANTALPIWAMYMNKIYADPNMNISKGDFPAPLMPLSIELDCNKYRTPQQENNSVKKALDFN
jgi:penicillin-binding protein 1A